MVSVSCVGARVAEGIGVSVRVASGVEVGVTSVEDGCRVSVGVFCCKNGSTMDDGREEARTEVTPIIRLAAAARDNRLMRVRYFI